MVEPRGMSQPILAGNLQVEMQGGTRLAPTEVVEGGATCCSFSLSPSSIQPARDVVHVVVLDRPSRVRRSRYQRRSVRKRNVLIPVVDGQIEASLAPVLRAPLGLGF